MSRTTKIIIASLLCIAATIALVSPLPAEAQALNPGPGVTNCGGIFDLLCGIGWILVAVANAVIWFAGTLLLLAVHVLEFMRGISEINGGPLNSLVVKEGFKVTLETVNLFFILIVIVIAFMTILRVEQYGIKKLLPRLIVAVLLVNFSLVFAGVILDASNAIAAGFLGKLNPAVIGEKLNPQNFLQVKGVDAKDFDTFLKSVSLFLVSAAFIVMFTVISAIVLFTAGFLLLIRYVWIVILLVLMPFAFLFWVTPRYASKAGDWWNKFLQWTFFLPVLAFFLYLAFNVQEKLATGDIQKTLKSVQGLSPDPSVGTLIQGLIQNALNLFVVLGLTIGGLIAAQKVGISAAGAGMTFAKNVASGLTGRKFGKFKAENVAKGFGTTVRKGISRVPLLRDVVRPLAPGITEDIKTRNAKKIVKRAEGPKIMEANPLETGTVQKIQTGVGKMQKKFKEIFKTRGAEEIVNKSQAGEEGFSEADIKKAAGSKWRQATTTTGTTGTGAAIGAAVGGPAGALAGAGIGYVTGRIFVERQARARMALAMLNAIKEDSPPGLSKGELKEFKKARAEKKKVQKEREEVTSSIPGLKEAKKYLGEQKKKKEHNEHLEHLAHDVHEKGGHGGHGEASHGSGGVDMDAAGGDKSHGGGGH